MNRMLERLDDQAETAGDIIRNEYDEDEENEDSDEEDYDSEEEDLPEPPLSAGPSSITEHDAGVSGDEDTDEAESSEATEPPPAMQSTTLPPPAPPSTPSIPPSAPASSSSTPSSRKQMQRLKQQNAALQQQLSQLQAEFQAQQTEVEQAATYVHEETAKLAEEREQDWQEQQAQLEELRDEQEQQLEALQIEHEAQVAELREQLEQALDLQSSTQTVLEPLQQEKKEWEVQRDAWEKERLRLEALVEGLQQSTTVAQSREQTSEAQLDEVREQYQQQLAQRQAREVELEQTVAELGAALSAAKKNPQQPARVNKVEPDPQLQHELETSQTQLAVVTRHNEALQKELQQLAEERTKDAAQIQALERTHHETLAKLNQLQRSRPTAQNDSGSRVRQLTLELDQAKQQVLSISDQLLRQQGQAESYKSEVLALKGRLQAATTRADTAEQTLQDQSAMEVPSRLRRRVKGGRLRHLQQRSIRSTLGLRVVHGGLADQVLTTVEAMDEWLMETGTILRHEPLARLGFALYFALVHLWCFALVCFHTVQSEHADIGTLTARRAMLHPGRPA